MTGPLDGLKVLDLSHYVAGPYCAMMLGDMGADVVKVERPDVGDPLRRFGPAVEGRGLYAMMQNRNKRSVAIDLARPGGQRLLRALAGQADVLVENFRPGVLERLGCAPDILHADNPRLVIARISGFGQDGPLAQHPCFDVVAQAMSGLMEMTGAADGPPQMAGTVMCDYTTAMNAVIGILAALQARHVSGRGQVVDVALLDVATSMLMTAIPEQILFGRPATRRGNRDRFSAPTNSYRTADSRWVHLVTASDPAFARLAAAMGRPALAKDPRFATIAVRLENVDDIDREVARWIASLTAMDAVSALNRIDIPCALVATLDEVVANPQLHHRRQITSVEHDAIGRVPTAGVTIGLSDTPLTIRSAMPDVGQHTAQVLASWLAYGAADVAQLSGEGVIAVPQATQQRPS
ncbi:MAG TPA: CoA transferase [Vineibacter sp.]|nr:CoA transferase [Vineibacter sp.]